MERDGYLNPKKLPPRHMIFEEEGKEGVVVVDGRPYARNGKPLPLDLAWLKKNNFCSNQNVIRALRTPEPPKKTKECDSCHSQVGLEAKYCPECGQPVRQVWVPGDGGVGERIQKLIDPDAPLDSLDALLNPLDQEALSSHRKTAAEMEALSPEELQQELGPLTTGALVAVPGEAPKPANPRFSKKKLGVVTHAVPTTTNSPVVRS